MSAALLCAQLAAAGGGSRAHDDTYNCYHNFSSPERDPTHTTLSHFTWHLARIKFGQFILLGNHARAILIKMTTTTTSVSTVGFRWMDILEKEFDKSFLAMDEVLRTVSEDYETPDMYDVNRKLLSGLGSCFVQAVHKAQTIFQSNAKQEAELVHLREELAEAKATADRLDAEKQYLVCRLQSALLENHKHRHQQNMENGSGGSGSSSSAVDADTLCSDIQSKLAKEMSVIQRVDWEARKSEEKCHQLERENSSLRRTQVELESELVGARLDSKYLDKELAGRIQQIQILLAGGGTSQEHKQKVWGQIEAEMHLQRSKTISNMCYSKQRVKESARAKSEEDTGSEVGLGSPRRGSSSVGIGGGGGGRNRSRVKQVHIHKNDAEELGMAILGGREHGLPVMISEVFPNTAVGRCRKICAGDVILAVNGDSFDDMGHHEAVKYLSALRGTIKFDLENRVDDEIEDVCDMGSRYYDMFDNDDDGDDDEARQRRIQQRSTQQRILLNHPGRAKEVQKKRRDNHAGDPSSPGSADRFKAMLPEVHSSPKKTGGGGTDKTVQQHANGRVA